MRKAGEEEDWKKKTRDRGGWKRLSDEAVKKSRAAPHPWQRETRKRECGKPWVHNYNCTQGHRGSRGRGTVGLEAGAPWVSRPGHDGLFASDMVPQRYCKKICHELIFPP